MRHLFSALLLLCLILGCSNKPQRFDLLIINGQVYDADKQTFFEANVGIIGDKITAVGKLKNAEKPKPAGSVPAVRVIPVVGCPFGSVSAFFCLQ